MDTIRCPQCKKLQRADAQVCSRCGYAFDRPSRRSGARQPHTQKPSLPPASPHRAGHHAGLHPEDHPYHSSMMEALQQTVHSRTVDVDEGTSELEVENTQSDQQNGPELNIPVPTRRASRFASKPQVTIPMTPKVESNPQPQASLHEEVPTSYVAEKQGAIDPISEPSFPLSNVRSSRPRATSLILLCACLFFLIMSSVLAFFLIGNKPSIAQASVIATPNQLRINDTFLLKGSGFGPHDNLLLTYDVAQPIPGDNGKPLLASTNKQGAFSLEIRVTHAWSIGNHAIHVTDEHMRLSVSTTVMVQETPSGPPQLQLATQRIDFDAAPSGTIATRDLTLINNGGNSLTWQASSDQPWLSVTPASGSFAGRATIQVKANRGTLLPHTYTGHLLFRTTNASESAPLTLTVTLGVAKEPASGTLVVSTASLAFSTGAGYSPTAQSVVIQNTGDQAINWTGTTLTGDGSPWLSMSPAEGRLPGHSSAIITIAIQSTQLAVGNYQGTLNFSSANSTSQVGVSLSVIATGNLVVSPPTLAFSTIVNQQPADKTITLQNTGALALSWQASASTADQGNWLSAAPTSGSLDGSQQTTLTVHIDDSRLVPGSYQGTLTFNSGGQAKQVAVSLTVSPPPAPIISVVPSTITFDTTRDNSFASQLISVTNVGQATLNWRTSQSNGSASLSRTQGTLNPGESDILTVSPTVATTSTGTFTTTITFSHSDPALKVQPVQLTITMVVTNS
ncbi:BACON domain-containing protein [Ktedonobacter racemifer]|uniref:BACON domain-containing protein n=1 Tax=Ktedonobacter racemifer TaxID=363277 RepID=UPI0009FD07BE|nr:choice-of-anchor D domain-containing protein [Ktedonobacter racemifer]